MRESANDIVFVSGVFNIIHPGHFRLLQYAKNLAPKIIVGIYTNEFCPEGSLSAEERLSNMQALSFVDNVFIMNKNVVETVKQLKPKFVVKGWEFREQNNDELQALERFGGRLIFSPNELSFNGFSDFVLESSVKPNAIHQPTGFLQRRKFEASVAIKNINDFSKLKVCVFGDLIVDEYVNCAAVGMSREDPTIVVRPENSSKFVGGAGIVAKHAKSLGAKVNLITVTGDDEAGVQSLSELNDFGIECFSVTDDSRTTTSKKRYRSIGKTLLRVNNFASHTISKQIQVKILEIFKGLVTDIDLLVFSDFSYGLMPAELVSNMISIAKEHGVFISADSQSSSQTGDLLKYRGASLVTPTEYEARTSLNDYESGLVMLSNKLRAKLETPNIVLTLAEDGVLITKATLDGNADKFETDRLPALQPNVVDVSGAGDAFMITTAMMMASEESLWVSSYLGSVASAIQVSREGNSPILDEDLRKVIEG